MMLRATFASLLACTFLTTPAFAQTGPLAGELGELVTDRPDFTESSEVVGRGILVLETGFTLEGDRTDNVVSRSITTPAMLARIGLGSRVELRLGGEGFLRGWNTTPQSPVVTGHSDFEVGAKVKFLAREKFAMSAIPIVSIPMNDPNYSSGAVDTTVKLTWATSLPREFDLSGNVNLASLSDAIGRFGQQAVSVSLGHDLVGGWGGYWEGYVFTPMERAAAAGWTLNSGVTHGIGPNMQVDIEVGRGVTTAAPDWFFGVGFAVRSPLRAIR